MKKVFKQFYPLFFIIFIWVIFSSPYILKNKVPYPSTYQVNTVPPWSYYEQFWGPVRNNAMPDIIGQLYPWRYFSVNMWKEGQIPFWNPYSFSGNPHIANYQSATFSPLNILFFILPFVDAWSVLILIQPLLAGVFMYSLLREFKISKIGSLLSGIIFMFSGFMVTWMAYGTMSMSIAFLPLALFGIEKFYNTKKLRYLTILSLSIPLSFFSGHFQTSLYFLIFIFAFIFYKSVSSRNIRYTFYLMLFVLFGLIISLPQIIPSIEFYQHSVRSGIFITKDEGMPFYYLVTMFAPDFFGNPVTRNDWFGFYAEWSSFIGIIPLVLAFLAVLGKKKSSLSLFFFITGILFLLFTLQSPIIELLSFSKIPVLSTSTPTRAVVLFSFSFAILAGFGLDNIKLLILNGKIKKILTPFLLTGVLILLIWVLLLIIKILPPDKLLIAKRNLFLPTLIFSGALISVLTSIKYKKLLLFTTLFLLFAVSFDSLRFVQKWMPIDPKEYVYADIPIISAMKKNVGVGRYFGNLGDQVDSYYGIQSIEGYDPLYIGKYGEFIRTAGDGKFLKAERSVVKLDRVGKYTDRALDLLGVTIVFHPIADTNQGWAYPVWSKIEKYNLIYKDSRFQLFKNKTAMGRAALFYKYQVISDPKKLLETFYTDNFDFRKTLLLEEDPNLKDSGGIDEKRAVKIISYTPNKVAIEVNTSKPALLFLSDNFYPGWKVFINGKKGKILRADYSFRAVVVPSGNSKIDFSYMPFSF